MNIFTDNSIKLYQYLGQMSDTKVYDVRNSSSEKKNRTNYLSS